MIFEVVFSQTTLTKYPEGQVAYQGGYNQLFTDMQHYFLKKGLTTCPDAEVYWVVLKIDETGKPFLIKRQSEEATIKKNNCAYELVLKCLGSLKNWQPAVVDGKNVAAYFQFPFIPKDFFDNFHPDYDITSLITQPEFPGGIEEFKKKVFKNFHGFIDWNTFNPRGTFTVFFEIDTDGKISNIEIEPKVANSELFFEDIKYAVKRVKERWTPAKLRETPTKFKYRWPIRFNSID
ncbi:MAG: hypothetical protein CFE24_12075 [Flavobacterium sp. BFFFF2]|nr:MAG: hypothetical protein CFE24_12075 [Flavobacterium sp. BFFFF2]